MPMRSFGSSPFDDRPAMSDQRLVFVRSKDGRLPYSKGVMTQTLTAAGITPERGHAIASLVERRLTDGGRSSEELTVTELHEYVERVKAEIAGLIERGRRERKGEA